MKTIKRQRAIRVAVWLRAISVIADYGCGLGCTPALSVTHRADKVYGLCRYLSAISFVLCFSICLCIVNCRLCINKVFECSSVCHTTIQLQLGNRAFCVAGPVAWNSLPLDIRSAPTLSSFNSMLKTTSYLSS